MSADVMAALVANDEQPATDERAATVKLLESLRLSIRHGQLELMANPDPTSPWWFLVDPHAEFTTETP